MKWVQIPSGPQVDLDEVVAIEDGRYDTGARFVLRSGQRVEVAASREALIAFTKTAFVDPRDREIARLRRLTEDLAGGDRDEGDDDGSQ